MLSGFCITEQADVPISGTGRCLADGSIVIAPSDGCMHQRFIGGAWTACLNIKDGHPRPCKAVSGGAFRAVLSQQDAVVAKHKADRARAALTKRARAFGSHAGVPAPTPEARTCPSCTREFVPKLGRGKTRRTCSATCAATWAAVPRKRLVDAPCPICGKGFRPKMQAGGKRQQVCSSDCALALRRVPTVPCLRCETPIKQHAVGAGKVRIYCSVACRAEHQKTAKRVPCPTCGRPFKPKRIGPGRVQKRCSKACAFKPRVAA